MVKAIFKMAAIRHVEFSKIAVFCHVTCVFASDSTVYICCPNFA